MQGNAPIVLMVQVTKTVCHCAVYSNEAAKPKPLIKRCWLTSSKEMQAIEFKDGSTLMEQQF